MLNNKSKFDLISVVIPVYNEEASLLNPAFGVGPFRQETVDEECLRIFRGSDRGIGTDGRTDGDDPSGGRGAACCEARD